MSTRWPRPRRATSNGRRTTTSTIRISWPSASIGWITIGVGVLVLVVSPLVKRLMHLDTIRDEEELAGYKEIGEREAAGTFPQREARPGTEQA